MDRIWFVERVGPIPPYNIGESLKFMTWLRTCWVRRVLIRPTLTLWGPLTVPRTVFPATLRKMTCSARLGPSPSILHKRYVTVLFLWLLLEVSYMALVRLVLLPNRAMSPPPLVGTLQRGPKLPLMLTSNLPPPKLCTRLQSERIPKLPLRNPLTAPVPVGDLITIRPPRTNPRPPAIFVIEPVCKSRKKRPPLFHNTRRTQ